MSTLGWVAAVGALAGLGVALVAAGLTTGRIDLGRLLAIMDADSDAPRTVSPPRPMRRGWRPAGPADAWLERVAGRVAGRVDEGDLDLIGETRERFALIRIGFTAGGALALPVIAAVAALLGVGFPIVVTVAACLAGAVVGWAIPPVLVRTQAAQARVVLRRALCSYLDLVGLERQADRGPVEALEHPTTIATSWAFLRLRAETDRARRLGQPPWHAMRALAAHARITELDDLGAILTLSQEEGASIVDSLSATATSMRQRLLAEDLAAAHEQNRTLDLPLSLLGLTIVLFLVFPGLYVLTTS